MTASNLTKLGLAAALILGLGTATPGEAGGLGDRFQNQRERIEEGIDNGSLTRKEAKRLKRQQADIREQRQDFAEDGLSDRERRILKRRLNQQSERIHDQRHDGQERD